MEKIHLFLLLLINSLNLLSSAFSPTKEGDKGGATKQFISKIGHNYYSFENALEMNFFTSTYALNSLRLFQLALKERDFYDRIVEFGVNNCCEFKNVSVPSNQILIKADNEKCRIAVQDYVADYEENVLNFIGKSKYYSSTLRKDCLKLIVQNPIAMYKMILRFSRKVSAMDDFCKSHKIHQSLSRFDNISLPNKYDVEDAAYGIMRIQNTYRSNIQTLSQGIIQKFRTGIKLNSNDCLIIGRFAKRDKYYDNAILWLEAAQSLALKEFTKMTNLTALNLHLQDAYNKHNTFWNEKYVNGSLLDLTLRFTEKVKVNKNSTKTRIQTKYLIRDEHILQDEEKLRLFKIQNYDSIAILARLETDDLCSGENYQTNNQKLKCWLDTSSHPYHRINPLKTELLHNDPILVRLHDFVSKNLRHRILKDTETSLRRSTVMPEGNTFANISVHFTRSSVNSWLTEKVYRYLLPLYKRIEFATGMKVLDTSAIEPLQVARYSALGSHYDPHADETIHNDVDYVARRIRGFRQMTFMFYLNDVTFGGSTAFPYLGTVAKPIKGSAVYWYNLHPNITNDERLVHAGCPVVLGEKFIATKWISTALNILNKKCPLVKEKSNSFQF